MNQRRFINILLTITLILSMTLGCNYFLSLPETPDPNQEIPALPDQGSPTLATPSTPGIASLSNTSAADLAERITRDDAS